MDPDQQFRVIADSILIDWKADGDEWLTRFRQTLNEQNNDLQMTGYIHDATTPFIRIHTKSSSTSEDHTLLLGAHDEGVVLVIPVINEDKIPSYVVAAWRAAASGATEALGRNYPEHEWSAIIGPTPFRIGEARGGVDAEGLVASGNFGGLAFSSSGQHMYETVPDPEFPSLGGVIIEGSVPIVVRGSSQGYSWDSASTSAAHDLNNSCGILSVAWGVCIVIRESPRPLKRGVREVPNNPMGLVEGFLPKPLDNPVLDREIHRWGQKAWQIVRSRPRVADAVAAFREGFKMESTNPSLALVGFIASIEAISQVLYRESRCTCCKAQQHIKSKFVEALKLVVSDEKAEQLGCAYSSRSLTVHRGRLYGFELIAGSRRRGIWSQDNQHDFLWKRVYPMREAGRALLTLALKGELPPKREFVLAHPS